MKSKFRDQWARMKRLRTVLTGILLAGLLAGCGERAAEISSSPTEKPSPPAESVAPVPTPAGTSLDLSQEPPLTEFSASIAVPDFLTQEQQDLYRRAHCLYQAMFGGDTSGIDYDFPADEAVEWETHDEDLFVLGDFRYLPASGRYQRWADFDALVHSVFTDDFWDSRNQSESDYPIYRDFNGRLGILELSRGSGYWYNDNFPDQFRLEEQTEDAISFTLISPAGPGRARPMKSGTGGWKMWWNTPWNSPSAWC